MTSEKFEITWSSLWKIFFLFILAVVLYQIRDILVVLFLGIVISVALDAPLDYLNKKKIPRLLGLLFIVLATVSILAILLYTIIPVIVIEFKELLGSFTQIENILGKTLGISQITEQFQLSLDNIINAIFAGDFSFLSIVPRIFENIALTIAVIFISFYLALYRDGVENFMQAVLPVTYEKYAINVYHRTREKIGKWLEGQVFLSLLIGIATFIGLKILGVEHSLVLGILAGFFEIIPLVGPFIAGILAVIIAFSQSVDLAVYTILLFVGIQQLESHLIFPYVMRKTTQIHPVIVILSVFIGGKIAGFVGVVLAIPVVVVIQELIEDFAARKRRQPTL